MHGWRYLTNQAMGRNTENIRALSHSTWNGWWPDTIKKRAEFQISLKTLSDALLISLSLYLVRIMFGKT
jgi:hypothetical protein